MSSAFTPATEENTYKQDQPPAYKLPSLGFRFSFTPDLLPINARERSSRSEDSWAKRLAKIACVAYGFFSCLLTISRLYLLCTASQTLPSFKWYSGGLDSSSSLTQAAFQDVTATSHLVSSLGVAQIEDNAISQNTDGFNVTICAWVDESEVQRLAGWSRNWEGPISVVVKSTAPPRSQPHVQLLRKLRTISSGARLSVHVVHVETSTATAGPNHNLNLARLFATTEWVLLYPGLTSPPIPRELSRNLLNTGKSGPQILSVGSKSYPYPFLAPVLIKRSSDFWCTERMFLYPTRHSDWDACLWQLSLELTGKIEVVKLPWKSAFTQDANTSTEVLTREQLSNRFHVEMCEAVIKYSGTSIRNRHKAMRTEWIKNFCDKVV
ncbi:hypothetical protein CPB83DRAFT_893509 [Crepidotus variabilis]|uniref:Uncharacterized protein n=1 Tax=Crepidotus variabilis TaxID=179855 RepID=A0A9P6JQA4_9AGAR|nr:hypothetical protein CPB83DRAFT_893509 [Crepidotus variabilis]